MKDSMGAGIDHSAKRKLKIVALVPMRHFSRRVPQKNYRDFNGRPLFYWILKTLSKVQSVDAIYIDTDSPVIKREAPLIHPKINIIHRPAKLRSEYTPMNDILFYDISQVDADCYLQTHTTNPFLKKETIERALRSFLHAKGKDSLFSVTKRQVRLWDERGCPLNHDKDKLIRTQDLAPVFEENSNIYIFTRKSFLRRKNRIGQKPIMFEIPKEEAWDIDDESDFKLSRFLAENICHEH